MFKKTKQPRDVQFLNEEEIKFIASPLTDKAYETIYTLMDRYIDYKMKEKIKAKINEESVDENLEIKLRGILEFRKFLNNLQ